MSLVIPYVNKGYEEILQSLKTRIPALTDNQWTDFLDSDPGYALMKAFSGMVDLSNFYLDRQAAETYLSTLESRDSAVMISKMLGYKPRRLSAARTSVKFSILSSYSESIIIPKGTQVLIENKSFFTTIPGTILVGMTEVTVPVVQGSPYSTIITSAGIRWMKTIHPKNLTDVEVSVENVPWSEVDSFIFSPVPTCFKVYDDVAGLVVMFGGGFGITYPTNGSLVKVTGVTTLGFAGNTTQNQSPATILSPIYNTLSQNISNLLTAVTLSAATGGSDEESLVEIKSNAPSAFASQNRCVTSADYETHARSTPGVLEARCWGGEEVGRYGEVYVCIAGSNRALVPQSLLDAVSLKLDPLRTIPMIVKVVPPQVVLVDTVLDVKVRYGYNSVEVQNMAVAALTGYISNLKISDMFQVSDAMTVIGQVPGVDYCNLSLSLRLTATFILNKLRVQLPDYTDPSTIQVKSGSTTLWSWGDAEGSLVDGYLTISLVHVGSVTVHCKSSRPDLYLVRDQILVLGSVQSVLL